MSTGWVLGTLKLLPAVITNFELLALTNGCDAQTSLWCPLVSSHLLAPWHHLVKLSHFFSKGVECNLKECHFEGKKTRFRRGDVAWKTTFQFGKECRRKIWEIAKSRVIIGEEITLGLLEFDYNEQPAITNRFLCIDIIDYIVKKSSVTTSTSSLVMSSFLHLFSRCQRDWINGNDRLFHIGQWILTNWFRTTFAAL